MTPERPTQPPEHPGLQAQAEALHAEFLLDPGSALEELNENHGEFVTGFAVKLLARMLDPASVMFEPSVRDIISQHWIAWRMRP